MHIHINALIPTPKTVVIFLLRDRAFTKSGNFSAVLSLNELESETALSISSPRPAFIPLLKTFCASSLTGLSLNAA